MDNLKIAAVFYEIASIMEITGGNPFKINAYQKAALIIENCGYDLRDIFSEDGDKMKIPGIGPSISKKIHEMLLTGKCSLHEKLKKSIPAGLLKLLEIRTVGPKRVKIFYEKLGISNLSQLKSAALKHKISVLPGFGEKSENEIIKAIDEFDSFSHERHLINETYDEANRLILYLSSLTCIDKIEYAGSLRRFEETIGDIDILVTLKSDNEKERSLVMNHFCNYPDASNVLAKGPTKSSIMTVNGIQIDVRVVDKSCYGAALQYFTGNRQHNILLREFAKTKGYKISEYGIFRNEKLLASEKESDVYDILKMQYIPPELRQGIDEIKMAQNNSVPKLVDFKDIIGDLHVHSDYSDGIDSVEAMASFAKTLGYKYISLCDHSPLVGITNGMTASKILKRKKQIDLFNRANSDFYLFNGCEVDILKDGTLFYDQKTLNSFELVVASSHLYSNLSSEQQTKRLIAAIENPKVNILGHPLGRIINKRKEIQFDRNKIFEACKQNQVALEINSSPNRLDLPDRYAEAASRSGCVFAINTDAHSTDQFFFIRFGVGLARRAAINKKQILNSYSLENLWKFLQKSH